MLEKFNEPIEVMAKFTSEKIVPSYFKWHNRTYKVEKINLVHKSKKGTDEFYHFSVSNHLNYFRLVFSTKDLSWRLMEVYFD